MKIKDLKGIINERAPLWVNEDDHATLYGSYADLRMSFSGDTEIVYLTVDSNAIITLEV